MGSFRWTSGAVRLPKWRLELLLPWLLERKWSISAVVQTYLPSSFLLFLFFLSFLSYIFNFYLFFFFERERQQAREGQREKERESQAGSILSVQSPVRGLNSWTVRSRPEPKPTVRRLTDRATPAPLSFLPYYIKFLFSIFLINLT